MEKLFNSNLDGPRVKAEDMVSLDRYVCTKDAPWSREKSIFAVHPDDEVMMDTVGTAMWKAGYMVRIRCKNCGHQWEESWLYGDH